VETSSGDEITTIGTKTGTRMGTRIRTRIGTQGNIRVKKRTTSSSKSWKWTCAIARHQSQSLIKRTITMSRRPGRLRPATWSGPELGYRPPTPYHPGFEEWSFRPPSYKRPSSNSRAPWRSYRHVEAARYIYDEDFQRQIDEQNAKIARRSPLGRGGHDEQKRSAPKRVRFALPAPRIEVDEDSLAWEFAKLSIRDPTAPIGMEVCSRCGQKIRRGRTNA